MTYLPPRFRLIVGVAFVTAFALILAACSAGPEVAAAVDAGDESAAALGTELQNLAGKAAGPVGYMAAGFFLPIAYAFLRSTLKGTAAAASVAVKDAAKSVGMGGPTP